MATTAHRIVSHYTTPSQEGQEVPEEDIDAIWQSESARIKRISARPYKIPTFVRGSGSLDHHPTDVPHPERKEREEDVVEWYRALSGSRVSSPKLTTPTAVAKSSSSTSSVSGQRSTSLPLPPKPSARHISRRTRPDWFIHRALRTQADGPASISATPSSSAGLAELLAQQPPPRPDEAPFKPPIWYGIGPGNKGFAMLKKSGWSEGYGLGSSHPAKTRIETDSHGGVSATSTVSGDVIDLTVSDPPTPEPYEDEDQDTIFLPSDTSDPRAPNTDSPSNALLTPLRPILKNDRLGIGLKAKKKSSLTRTEIREHVRAGEAARRKAEIEKRGKDHRAMSRHARKEEEQRMAMMSYMNS